MRPLLLPTVLAIVAALGASHARAAASDAAPAAAQAKKKLLVLDVKGTDLDKSQSDTLTALIASRAARFNSLAVTSSADLRDLVALEADKQSAGCDLEAASCLGEIAGAMGADYVLSTRAGKLDAVFVVSLQLFDAKNAAAVGRASVQGWSLAELPEKIGPAVDELLHKATGETPGDVVSDAKPATRAPVDEGVRTGLQIGGVVAASLGVVVVALGVVPAFQYADDKAQLGRLTTSFTGKPAQLAQAKKLHQAALDARDLYNNVGRWGAVTGAVLVVAGAASAVAGFVLPGAGAE